MVTNVTKLVHIISNNLLKNELISRSSQQRQLQQHIANHSGISARSAIKSRDIFPLFEISVDVHTLAKTKMTSISNRKQQNKVTERISGSSFLRQM